MQKFNFNWAHNLKQLYYTARVPLFSILTLFAINIGISIFPLKREYLEIAHDVILVIIILTVAWVLMQALALIERLVKKKCVNLPGGTKSRRNVALYTKIHIIRNILTVMIVIIAVAASLMVFDKVRNIGVSLLASAGFLTAIFALAAQKSLGSLFVGIQLMLSHPLEIGDHIVVENENGVVEEITLSYVIVKLSDSRRYMFPISYFIERPFQTWSRTSTGVGGTIKLYVDHMVPIEMIRQELYNMIKNHPLWNGQSYKLSVSDFKENSVELKISVTAENPDNLDSLRSDIREHLLKYLTENYKEILPKLRITTSNPV